MKFEIYIEKAHEAVPNHTFSIWLHTGECFDVKGPDPFTAMVTLLDFHRANWGKVKDKPAFDDEHLAKHGANEKALAAQPTTPVKDKDYDE